MSWIKIRTNLLTDPRVVGMARALGVTRQHVTGCLLAVWTLADAHAVSRSCHAESVTDSATEGFLARYTAQDIDEAALQPGFATALVTIGWLIVYEDGVAFPEWDVHNGTSAKTRALEQKRQTKSRAKKAPGEAGVTKLSRSERDRSHAPSVTREETPTESLEKTLPSGEKTPLPPAGGTPEPAPKKRADAAKAVPVPEPLRSPDFLAAWAEWLDDRHERRKPLTAGAARQQLAKLVPLGPGPAAECVRLSIQNGWFGIFPERFSRQHATGPPQRGPAPQETVAEKLARLQASGQVPTVA